MRPDFQPLDATDVLKKKKTDDVIHALLYWTAILGMPERSRISDLWSFLTILLAHKSYS